MSPLLVGIGRCILVIAGLLIVGIVLLDRPNRPDFVDFGMSALCLLIAAAMLILAVTL